MTVLQEKQVELQIKQVELQKEQTKNTQTLIEQGLPVVEQYFSKKMQHVDNPRFKWATIVFGLILFTIVVGSGILVYEGKIDAGNFTFLLGVIVGYMMTFMEGLFFDKG